MSEQNNGKAKSSVSTIVATAIVAAAAVAAIIVLIVMNKGSGAEQNSGNSGISVSYKDTQEFADECGENAQKLVAGNYRIVRLFISEGLPYRGEPYGNRPEDGLYTVISDEFKTYEDINSLVRSVFVEEEANKIMMRMPLDPAEALSNPAAQGTSFVDAPLIAVYWSRDEYVDVGETSEDNASKVPGVVVPSEDSENETESRPSAQAYVKQSVLGISERFKPYTDYKKPWGSTSIKIVPVSEEECDITIYLGADKDVDLSSVEDTDILHTKMVKVNGEWRLTNLVY